MLYRRVLFSHLGSAWHSTILYFFVFWVLQILGPLFTVDRESASGISYLKICEGACDLRPVEGIPNVRVMLLFKLDFNPRYYFFVFICNVTGFDCEL